MSQIERAFPYIERPRRDLIGFDDSDLDTRDMLLLLEGCSKEIPAEISLKLYGDLSNLAAAGFSWVLPSYLRAVVSLEDAKSIATEFLIYQFGPPPEFAASARARCSMLNVDQVTCLLAVFRYWQEQTHWGQYCAEDLQHAQMFLHSLPCSASPAAK